MRGTIALGLLVAGWALLGAAAHAIPPAPAGDETGKQIVVAPAPAPEAGTPAPAVTAGAPTTAEPGTTGSITTPTAPAVEPEVNATAASAPSEPAVKKEKKEKKVTTQQTSSETALTAPGTADAAKKLPKPPKGCTRLGFLVNDYGKEGPARDAKELLDKYIATWTAERGITKYTVGPKTVECELFLNFIIFDEHTCTASANVCY